MNTHSDTAELVLSSLSSYLGGAGLGVPALELREVRAVGVGHGGAEVVARHGRAVVPRKVEVHALAEPGPPQESLVHADHLPCSSKSQHSAG